MQTSYNEIVATSIAPKIIELNAASDAILPIPHGSWGTVY